MATHPLDMSMSLLDLWYYVSKQAKDKDALIDIMIKLSYKINSLSKHLAYFDGTQALLLMLLFTSSPFKLKFSSLSLKCFHPLFKT